MRRAPRSERDRGGLLPVPPPPPHARRRPSGECVQQLERTLRSERARLLRLSTRPARPCPLPPERLRRWQSRRQCRARAEPAKDFLPQLEPRSATCPASRVHVRRSRPSPSSGTGEGRHARVQARREPFRAHARERRAPRRAALPGRGRRRALPRSSADHALGADVTAAGLARSLALPAPSPSSRPPRSLPSYRWGCSSGRSQVRTSRA